MLIQPLIENSVKHGVRSLKSDGHITVSFEIKENTLIVIVEDNGVGRAHAQQYRDSSHNGLGMKILQERLTLLNEKKRTDIHHIKIIDLFNNGSPSGTKAEVHLMLEKAL